MSERIAQIAAAAKDGRLQDVRRLHALGTPLDDNSGDGNSALFNAAYHGRTEVLEWILAQPGVDINALNSTGSTALTGAAEQGKLATVELLLQAGADAAIANNHKMTVRGYAEQHRHTAVVEMLDNPPAVKGSVPQEISYAWKVDNRVLQEIFNFEKKERVTLIRNGAKGPVEAVTRSAFSELSDTETLRKAFNEYKEKGGPRGEAEIFGNALAKPKLREPNNG